MSVKLATFLFNLPLCLFTLLILYSALAAYNLTYLMTPYLSLYPFDFFLITAAAHLFTLGIIWALIIIILYVK